MKIEPDNFPSTAAIPSLAIIAAREFGHDALNFSNLILAALWEEDLNIDDPKIICYDNGACSDAEDLREKWKTASRKGPKASVANSWTQEFCVATGCE